MSNLCTFQFFKSFFEKKIVTLFLELFTSSSYTRVPKTTIIYGTVTEICKEKVVIMYYSLPFYSSNNQKNQNFEKMKNPSGDVTILHMRTKNHDHMMYAS